VKNRGIREGFFLTFAAMFEKLQQKWKVGGLQLALILCTFAIGGSLTGYAGRKLMPLLGIESNGLWILIYIILITLIWPLAVLLISIPFGQFRFFTRYLLKIGRRMGLVKGENKANNAAGVKRIAIFASGAGSNAQKIIAHFHKNRSGIAKIALIVCNNPNAGVIAIAKKENIPVLLVERDRFFEKDAYLPPLHEAGINFIVLAGFLWKIPSLLITAYPDKIVNIHPALLPNYGGKGMYGRHVHQAVIANKEKESGITIHLVDEKYDHGRIVFQTSCSIAPNETAAGLANTIQALEYKHYPETIEKLLQ